MAKGYKLKVENKEYDWPEQFITGRDVRALGPGIPEGMDLFLKEKGKVGRLIALDEPVDLDSPGIEKFYAQDASSEAGKCRC
jgi:hypothetical protein